MARRLPADGVLLEFQRYRPYIPSPLRGVGGGLWDEPRYQALLLNPDGGIGGLDLGPAAPIDGEIRRALAATREEQPGAWGSWRRVADRILTPLRPHLEGRSRWFLSPDGLLHGVPFAVLPGVPAGSLHLISSGRDLLAHAAPVVRPGPPLVLADPAVAGWPRLPATAREGRRVAELLGGSLREGAAASVAALQRARGPRVLHVASHGVVEAGPASGDPMLTSALVLAGADRHRAPDPSGDADDGYLTAREAAQLRLDGTELVVLAACDSGLGELRSAEGLHGMQRALTVAGARATLLSLWPVDDEATAWFMRRFHARLAAGDTPSQALAAVQEEFRSRPKLPGWSHPRHWAGWQLTESGME